MKQLAPALHNGIILLESLNQHGSMSLESLSKITNQSKSSMLRLLDTLCQHGWVKKDLSSKQYESLVSVRFNSDMSDRTEKVIERELTKISNESKCTAEWYVPRANGMEIILRSEPSNVLVCLKAKIGFVRAFQTEFDAVSRIASKVGLHFPDGKDEYGTHYLPDKEFLPASVIAEAIDDIDESLLSFDRGWNSNGVRRFAIGVLDKDKSLLGVLALAESFTPNADSLISNRIELLKEVKFKIEASERL